MAQSQPAQPPRAFSPPQPSPSPVASQPGFALPPTKRIRTDGPSPQPESPYPGSPYAMSPTPGNSTPTNIGSPAYVPNASTPGAYPAPYTNGHPNTGLTLPDTRPNATSPIQPPQPMQTPVPLPQYTTATMTPMMNMNAPAPPGAAAGVMGPPQRPAERPTKDYEYDVTDSLAGTGIDLRAEEQYMSELYSTVFDANTDGRTGFAQLPPGPKSTFYGAGPANQPAQVVSEQDQDRFAAQAAEQAWNESSTRLAISRAQEVNDAFLLVPLMHRRADKIAREHGLTLNLDLKSGPSMGKLRTPETFPPPKITVKTRPGPDSTMINTYGSFIPHDAYLADQLALLSLATKQRLRELVADANIVATTRQKTSHGDVPEEWVKAAGPMNAEALEPMVASPQTADLNGAASPGTSGVKRSVEEAELPNSTAPTKLPKIGSHMMTTMREMARQEREWEETRLRRRQKRKDGVQDVVSTPSRAGSVAVGTPGSVAPEPEKISKKELKKNQAMKAAEANSHANQNLTSSMFAGLGGKGGLFGKKKTGKTYDWMNLGRGGSGASTPTRSSTGPGKGPGTSVGSPAPGNMALTAEGRNRLGTWREDKEKGKNIQLRDWTIVLERDGREPRALQQAYIRLDDSNPSDIANTRKLTIMVTAVLFLPEASDYVAPDAHTSRSLAVSQQISPFVLGLREAAEAHGVAVHVGIHHTTADRPNHQIGRLLNRALFISADGAINDSATYDKLHVFDYGTLKESATVQPGTKLTAPFDSPVGRIGSLICFDLRFPETAIALAQPGPRSPWVERPAQILTYPSAFTIRTGEAHWETLLRSRAIETQSWVVASAQVGKHNEKRASYGRSMVVDPWGRVVLTLKGVDAQGNAEDGAVEDIGFVDLDMTELERVRREMPLQRR
ncbi:hypothetical protein S7711_06169, partial [Stachybotrys chartarum IBT 7711]